MIRERTARIVLSLACFIAIAGILGCPKPAPPVVNPPDAADAHAWNGGPATCLDYCRRGTALGCAWAKPTPAGAPCVDVCANNQKVDIAAWDLDCRTAATSCNPPKCQ